MISAEFLIHDRLSSVPTQGCNSVDNNSSVPLMLLLYTADLLYTFYCIFFFWMKEKVLDYALSFKVYLTNSLLLISVWMP